MKTSFLNKLSNLCQVETTIPKYIEEVPTKILKEPILTMQCGADVISDFYIDIIDWNTKNELAFALTHTIYSISTNGINLLYQAESDNEMELRLIITSIAFYTDNLLVFGDSFGILRIFEIQTKRILFEQQIHDDRINKIIIVSNFIITGSKDGSVKIIDPRQQNIVNNNFISHQEEICGMTVNHNQTYVASGCNDGIVKVVDFRSSLQLHSHKHNAAVKAITFSPTRNNILLTGGGLNDRQLKMYNVETHELVRNIQSHSQISGLIWKQNNIIVSHGNPINTLDFYDDKQFVLTNHSSIHTEKILYMKMNINGYLATFDSNHILNLWKF